MNSPINTLYRVVSTEQWDQATATGLVPRCPADERENRVHLNERKDVELVADLWFAVEEQPLALELDVSDVASDIRWDLRVKEPAGTWPNLYAPNIRVEQVLAVHRLVMDPRTGRFQLETSNT